MQRIADLSHIPVKAVKGIGFAGLFASGGGLIGVGEYALALVPWLMCALWAIPILWSKQVLKRVGTLALVGVFYSALVIWTVAKKGDEPWTNFAKLFPVSPSTQMTETPHTPTLLTLFKRDLPHTFRVTVDSNMSRHPIGTRPPNTPEYEYKSQLYVDWLSKSKFLGFYLPAHMEMAQVMIDVVKGHQHLLADFDKRLLLQAGRLGDQPMDMNDLVFTGQVFLYYEGSLSPHEKARVIDSYKAMGLSPQFRGLDYLLMRKRG